MRVSGSVCCPNLVTCILYSYVIFPSAPLLPKTKSSLIIGSPYTTNPFGKDKVGSTMFCKFPTPVTSTKRVNTSPCLKLPD